MAEKKEKKKDPQRCTTPAGRLSYPNLFKPKAFAEGDEPMYDAAILIPKTANMKDVLASVEAAKEKKYGADKSKWPHKISKKSGKRLSTLRNPIKDGDEMSDKEGYAGCWVLTPRNKHRPLVVDGKRLPIDEKDDRIYPGCFVKFGLRAYVYEAKGNKGVTFSLDAVQKFSDGPRFDGRPEIDEVFEEVEDESEDPDNYEKEDDEEEDGEDW